MKRINILALASAITSIAAAQVLQSPLEGAPESFSMHLTDGFRANNEAEFQRIVARALSRARKVTQNFDIVNKATSTPVSYALVTQGEGETDNVVDYSGFIKTVDTRVSEIIELFDTDPDNYSDLVLEAGDLLRELDEYIGNLIYQLNEDTSDEQLIEEFSNMENDLMALLAANSTVESGN